MTARLHEHTRRRRGTPAAALAAACLIALAPAWTMGADAPAYTLDNDPIRLGNRQLEAGDWAAAAERFTAAREAGYRLDEACLGLGTCALRQGQYTQAEEHLSQALAARGGAWPAVQAELGLLALRRGEVAAAEAHLAASAAAEPKSWPARYGQALLALHRNEWEAARDLAESAKNRKGVLEGEDRYHHVRALVYLANGALAQAEVEAMQAQNLDPLDPRYTELVARVHLEQGHDELAIAAWEQLLAQDGPAPGAETLHELGRLYAKAGRPNEARARFEQACAADSTFTPALRDLAELYRRAKKPEQAARTWLRYAQMLPGDIEAQLGLAAAMGELGRHDEAAAAAARALALDANRAEAQLAFQKAGLRSRDADLRAQAGAAAEARQAGAAVPPEGWTLDDQFALAEWQQAQQRPEAALATLQAAARMDSTHASVPFQMGLLELRAGRTAEATTHFGRALALDPQSGAAQLNLGIARFQGGDARGAIADFRAAVAGDGANATARLLLAQALAAADSLTAAEQQYRQVLALEAGNARAQRGLGFCRLRAGDYPAAAAAYERSTQDEPGNADGWAGLGSARLGQGRLDAAQTAFAKARAIDPQNPMLRTGSELLNQARNAGKDSSSR
ncbi:MAG: tetratricopeptide repeat protein [bacterium]|nr:tetratricopeptide repeat protein [bacterium]